MWDHRRRLNHAAVSRSSNGHCQEHCRICTGTGLPPATSAPRLGSPLPHLHRDWASPNPHLHWDWAYPGSTASFNELNKRAHNSWKIQPGGEAGRLRASRCIPCVRCSSQTSCLRRSAMRARRATTTPLDSVKARLLWTHPPTPTRAHTHAPADQHVRARVHTSTCVRARARARDSTTRTPNNTV